MIKGKLRDRSSRATDPPTQLKRLARILVQLGCFERETDAKIRLSILERARTAGIKASEVSWLSLKQRRGRIFLAAKLKMREALVCFEHSSLSYEERPSLLLEATRYRTMVYKNCRITAYVSPLTADNLLKLGEQELPGLLPRNMKTTPRLGLGVRMLFSLPPLLEAVEKAGCQVDFQLSGGREFSLREVIKARPGRYPEWLGHTGLDAPALYGTIAKECFKSGRSPYGTEIDHLIISLEPSSAISRIRGHTSQHSSASTKIDQVGLEESIDYCQRVIDEATRTRLVVGLTTDTSALFREEVDDASSWSESRLQTEYETQVPSNARKALAAHYHPGVPHAIRNRNGSTAFELTFSEEELARLSIRFRNSLLVNKILYEHMRGAMQGRSFTFELSLDEAYRSLTTEKELFFYLTESDRMGMKADLIAPNVGFRKREDYKGDLSELEKRVCRLATIASHFDAILDFHSGSDKRPEVYRTISKACSGNLKLKMSTVFQLLYFETLASFGRRSEERAVFERLWNFTFGYAQAKAAEGDLSARKMLEKIEQRIRSSRSSPSPSKSAKDEFFRHYSFITVAAKNSAGRYVFRNTLYRLAEKPQVAKRYRRRVIGLTLKVAGALGLAQANSSTRTSSGTL